MGVGAANAALHCWEDVVVVVLGTIGVVARVPEPIGREFGASDNTHLRAGPHLCRVLGHGVRRLGHHGSRDRRACQPERSWEEGDVMPARSAGLLVYRILGDRALEVLLVHPGGPFWAKKEQGAWSIPKGEHDPGDEPLSAAEREFREEVGQEPPEGPRMFLGEVTQTGGKQVTAWAVEGDLDAASGTSNTFELEWPRGSGVVRTYPEVDRVEWTPLATARVRLLQGQRPLLDRLLHSLGRQDELSEAKPGETVTDPPEQKSQS